MVGKEYDKGLAKLKTLVETFPAADISGISGEAVNLAAQKIYFVSVGPLVLTDMAAIDAAIAAAYAKIGEFLKANNLTMQGAPMTITTSYDKSGWKFDAAAPVAANEVAPSAEVKAGATYAGKAVQFVHVGPYEKLGDTVTKADAWLAVQGLKPKERLIEGYVSDPGNTPAGPVKTPTQNS